MGSPFYEDGYYLLPGIAAAGDGVSSIPKESPKRGNFRNFES
jgi:hypothetical protein